MIFKKKTRDFHFVWHCMSIWLWNLAWIYSSIIFESFSFLFVPISSHIIILFFFYHLNSTIWYLVFGNKLLFRLFYYLIPEINQFFSIIPMKKRNGRSRSWRHGQTEFGIEIVLKHMKKFRIRKHSNLLKYCIIEDLR